MITSQVTNLVAGVGLPSTQRTYDGLGRLATETNEAGRVMTMSYSATGLTTTTAQSFGARITTIRVGRRDSARVSTRVENRFGEVVRETQSGVGGETLTTTRTYDAAGRLVRVERTGFPIEEYEYDALGRRAATVDAAGARTTYGYNDDGELASVTDPLGNTTRYEYDLRGEKTYAFVGTRPQNSYLSFTYK